MNSKYFRIFMGLIGLLAVVSLVNSSSYAERIFLKSGEVVEGMIIEDTGDAIRVDPGVGIPLTYFKDSILYIGASDATREVPSSDSGVQELAMPKVGKIGMNPGQQLILDKLEGMDEGGLMILSFAFLGFFVVFYVLYSYFLMVIGRRLGAEYTWLAWVPIANQFYPVYLGALQWWWVILLLVPWVNILVTIYIWIKITQRRKKPAWLGILSALPLINLFFMIYLAKSD